MVLAEISDRWELRHNPRGRIVRLSAATLRNVFERHHADFFNLEFRDRRFSRRQRSAVHSFPSHVHRDRLVSQEAFDGPPIGFKEGAGAIGAICARWVCFRFNERRPDIARREEKHRSKAGHSYGSFRKVCGRDQHADWNHEVYKRAAAGSTANGRPAG